MRVHEHRPHPPSRAGFALVDLIVVVVVVSFFAAICSSLHSRLRERTYITIDLNNVRQILHGSTLYNSDNNGYMAHPTWGGDLTGPDGWAYLTAKAGREVPGATMNVPGSCAGVDVDNSRFTNQLAFFKVGQVSQYLPDVRTAWCPKDVATRYRGRLRTLWIGRPMKVTSYSWNGTIGGYVGPRAAPLNGKTYKVSQFQPADWQMWEGNESDSFHFNDAADHPESIEETFSRRHAGPKDWLNSSALMKRGYPGGAVVGTFGGSAQYVRWPKVFDLVVKKIPAPNEILNGPGYR